MNNLVFGLSCLPCAVCLASATSLLPNNATADGLTSGPSDELRDSRYLLHLLHERRRDLQTRIGLLLAHVSTMQHTSDGGNPEVCDICESWIPLTSVEQSWCDEVCLVRDWELHAHTIVLMCGTRNDGVW